MPVDNPDMFRLLSLSLVIGTACGSAAGENDLAPAPTSPAAAPTAASPSTPELNPRLLRRFRPLRVHKPADAIEENRIALGKMLFFDPRMSRGGDTSCNTCHALDQAGVDRRPTSVGTGGKIGARNAPTVYNVAWHVAQFWDGRAADLETQAKGPILNPDEMAMRDPEEVVHVVRGIPGYVTAFEKAFPGQPITFDRVADAIASFERTLGTPGRWDRFLDGDRTALTKEQIEGVRVFADVGCVQCHTGELLGGMMFQKVGLIEPWPNQKDQGRYEVTHQASDRMVFKVPSLRNVAQTAPYFHDGSVADLDEAVRMMGRHQLGMELTPAEVTSIVAWLGALTGEPPRAALQPPTLP
jgi:cytochrome c peroxidase